MKYSFPHLRRIALLVLLSVLLHGLFMRWIGAAVAEGPGNAVEPPVVMVALQQEIPAAPAPKPAPAVPAVVPDNAAAAMVSDAVADAVTDTVADTPPALQETPHTDRIAGLAPVSAPEKKAVLPASVLMKLEVKLRLHIFGINLDGELEWKRRGGNYALRLETLIEPDMRPDFKLLRKSSGVHDGSGLAPMRYTEQRGKRAEVATNFQRQAPETGQPFEPAITFSRVTDRVPLLPGAQDQLSVLMQLGALLQKHPEWLEQPGTTFAVPVASTRDVQEYRFTLIGAADVQSGLGAVRTWYLRSQPLADRYATRIEAWLAPQHDYLPIRMRFSSEDGITIETVVQEIVPHND